MSSLGSHNEQKPSMSGPSTPLGMLRLLPIELREKVYQCLVGHQFSQFLPDAGTDDEGNPCYSYVGGHKYKFDTTIFRVNKTIHREAQEYFYQHNGFILLEHFIPNFSDWLHAAHVPTVVESLPTESTNVQGSEVIPFLDPRFDHWCLRINISWPTHWQGLWAHNPDAAKCIRKVTLLMLQDLDALCLLLEALCGSATPNCVFVDHPRRFDGERVTRVRKWEAPYVSEGGAPWNADGIPETVLEVRASSVTSGLEHELPITMHKRLGPAAQVRALQQFRSVVGIGYNLSTIGFAAENHSIIKAVKKSTAPRIIWIAALEMSRLDWTLRFYKRVKSLLLAGLYISSWSLTSFITCLVTGVISPAPKDNPSGLGDDHDASLLAERRKAFKVEVFMNDAWGALLTESFECLSDRMGMEAPRRFRVLAKAPSEMLLMYHYLRALHFMVLMMKGTHTVNQDDLEHEIAEIYDVIGDEDEDIVQDMSLIEEFLAQIQSGVTPSLELHRESILLKLAPFRQGPRIFESYLELPGIDRPEKFQRWQDVEMLEQMSEETKKECEVYAAANGLMDPWRDDSSDE